MPRKLFRMKLSQHSGASLPIALFIVTVLSLIVLSMGQLQESSGQAASLQIQSQRALFAAESGVQITLAQVIPETENAQEVCAAGYQSTIEFSVAGLGGCQANISLECVASDATINPSTDADLVVIRSRGECGTDSRRTVEVSVR